MQMHMLDRDVYLVATTNVPTLVEIHHCTVFIQYTCSSLYMCITMCA